MQIEDATDLQIFRGSDLAVSPITGEISLVGNDNGADFGISEDRNGASAVKHSRKSTGQPSFHLE